MIYLLRREDLGASEATPGGKPLQDETLKWSVCPGSTRCVNPFIDLGDFFDPRVPLPVGELEDCVSVPMKMIGDKRYLSED
jgi:hypothetical protein